MCFVSCQVRFTSSAQMLEADVRMVALYRTLYRRSIARCHFARAYCSGVLWSSICLVVTIDLFGCDGRFVWLWWSISLVVLVDFFGCDGRFISLCWSICLVVMVVSSRRVHPSRAQSG